MQKRKFDGSIHFTIKEQILEDILRKVSNWLENNSEILNFSEDFDTHLHHCFLPRHIVEEKQFDTALVDALDELGGEKQIRWFGVSDLEKSRMLMLENLRRLNGVALFVGKIREGVKEEYDFAQKIGVHCIIIP